MILLSKFQKTIFITAVCLTANAHAVNQKPIADAGVDQNVSFSTNVTISGAKSLDSDGIIKTYQWTQTKGTKIILQNAKSVSTTFESPKKVGELVFKLTIRMTKKR